MRQTDGLLGNSGTNSMPLSAAKMKQEDTFYKTFIFHSSETTTTNTMRLEKKLTVTQCICTAYYTFCNIWQWMKLFPLRRDVFQQYIP
jgi:hypothetical protein